MRMRNAWIEAEQVSVDGKRIEIGRSSYIVLGQQVHRAEDFIILKIEAPCGLEIFDVCGVCRILRWLFWTSLLLLEEMLLAVGMMR